MIFDKDNVVERVSRESSNVRLDSGEVKYVTVKPIYKEKWHGNHTKNKMQGCHDTIRAQYSAELGRFNIDFEEGEQALLEGKLGLEEGGLTPSFYNKFWQDLFVKIEDKANLFDMRRPIEVLKMKILKGHDWVANSLDGLNKGEFPGSRYVIYDQEQENKAKAVEGSKKARAYAALNEMTPERMSKVLYLLGEAPSKNISSEALYGRLVDQLEDNPVDFYKHASKADSRIENESLIYRLLKTGILVKKGTAYYYNNDQLGFDFDAAADYLENPANQELKITLIKYLEKKEI
jgi:hypothetical protein